MKFEQKFIKTKIPKFQKKIKKKIKSKIRNPKIKIKNMKMRKCEKKFKKYKFLKSI